MKSAEKSIRWGNVDVTPKQRAGYAKLGDALKGEQPFEKRLDALETAAGHLGNCTDLLKELRNRTPPDEIKDVLTQFKKAAEDSVIVKSARDLAILVFGLRIYLERAPKIPKSLRRRVSGKLELAFEVGRRAEQLHIWPLMNPAETGLDRLEDWAGARAIRSEKWVKIRALCLKRAGDRLVMNPSLRNRQGWKNILARSVSKFLKKDDKIEVAATTVRRYLIGFKLPTSGKKP